MCGRPFRYTQHVILTAAGAVCRGSFGVHSLGSFLLQVLCSRPLRCGVPALFHCSFTILSPLFRSSIGVRGTSWRLFLLVFGQRRANFSNALALQSIYHAYRIAKKFGRAFCCAALFITHIKHLTRCVISDKV